MFIAKDDGTASRKLLTAPVPTFLRWSPDGSRLRFTQRNPNTGLGSLWEVSADGSNLHQLLPGWNSPSAECCGMWTPDGRYYLFLSQQPFNATSNIWVIREADSFFRRGNSAPVQLTSGPLSFTQFGLSADGKKVFARAELVRGELQRYDEKSGHFVTYLSGVSAEGVNFSRDGEWVTYVAYPEFTLWRSRVDGSERLQLSFPPMWAALPHWSPDGKRIAFVATTPGKPTKIYLISAEGGAPEELFPEGRSQVDPSWSPDGKSVVFGRDAGTETKEINFFNLRTKQVSALPGSEGLFSPRCSPDGRYVAAMSADSKKLMLYDFTTGKWEDFAEGSFGYPSWSRDGKYIYAERLAIDSAIIRVRLNDRKIEQVVSLKDFGLVNGVLGPWSGLAADDSVMVLHNIGSQELYALDWVAP
jgi:Tol biopolymer transport system component